LLKQLCSLVAQSLFLFNSRVHHNMSIYDAMRWIVNMLTETQ
jgi:hypothetical protein